MAIEPITTSGPTVTVSTLAELKAAYRSLSHEDGGGEILVEPGAYGALNLYVYGVADGTEPVIIKSADPDDPARFTEINLRTCENIRIESVHVDSTGVERDGWKTDLNVQDADTIQIVNSTFIHDEGDALKATGKAVEMLGGFRESANVLFEGNYVDGYFLGLDVMNTTNFEIVDNEITNIQSDGIRGGGMQDGVISGNYIHDVYPISQSITHSDLIQIWGVNVDQITKNVTISDNVLMNSDAGTQGIFIRSGELGKDSSETSGYFQDITISNNLIYAAHIHGITVDDVDGLVVDSNTVLWNPEAIMFHSPGEEINYQPIIYTRGSLDVTVTDNIAARIKGDGLVLSPEDGNQVVTYDNPAETSYAGHHFVNPFAGAGVSPEDLQMLPSSPWYGIAGTSIGNDVDDFSDGVTAVIVATPSTDIYELTFDAGRSFDSTGSLLDGSHTFHWTFADGSTAEGASVTKLYDSSGFKGVDLEIRQNGETVADITRNFAVETKDIFALDFEGGVVDISDAVTEVIDRGETVSDGGDTAFRVGDGNKLELGRGTEGLFGVESFGFAFDMKLTGDEQTGTFLHFYHSMEGQVTKDGSIQFKLATDEGSYTMKSREPVFDDGEEHRVGIAFDGTTGQLEMFVDGESVSSTEAWGATKAASYYNLVFGNTWGDSVDMLIDNVVMNRDPSVAGDLAEIAPPVQPPAAPAPAPAPAPTPQPPAAPDVSQDTPQEDPQTPPAAQPPAAPEVPQTPPQNTPQTPPQEDPQNTPAPQPDPDPAGPRLGGDNGPDTPGVGERGMSPDPVETSPGSDNFLSKILDQILELFGLGGGDDGPIDVRTAEAPDEQSALLTEVIPCVEMAEADMVACQDDQEADPDDLAA